MLFRYLYTLFNLLRLPEKLSHGGADSFPRYGELAGVVHLGILRGREHVIPHDPLQDQPETPGPGTLREGFVGYRRKCVPVEPEVDAVLAEEFSVLSYEGVFRLGQDSQELLPPERFHMRDDRESAYQLRDETEGLQVGGRNLV